MVESLVTFMYLTGSEHISSDSQFELYRAYVIDELEVLRTEVHER